MSAVTSSTMDIDQFSSDPFVDFATPLNDTPIPLDLRSDPRPKSPNLESGSSSLSSVPSTPTNRRRHALPKPKFAALQEAAREVCLIAAEIKEARAEYKHTRGLFEHRTRDENATIEILDAAVDATNMRLVRAVEEAEKIQSGNPPRHVPYPPETIPELLEAVEKAEADRENWYAETRRLFWIFEEIDRERLPALKRRMDSAREKEAAARMKAGQAAAAAGCERPITGTESASDFPPPTVRRVRPDETPVASPATSDTSDQATIVRSIRNAMRPATDVAGAPETPTKKSRR
ncbi:hypothetical protein LX36DRAFT_738862 [Colletotrichum falcatum]|nr:hypothetical protein LX36DRAFT_738862 [Colletotrichum falcatum]